MKIHRPGRWGAITCLWLGLIFFSSTSLAARWAGYTFAAVWTLIPVKLLPRHADYGWSSFAAEKSFHIILFAALGILLWKMVPRHPKRVWLIVLTGTLIGSASEFYQSFFVGRDPTVRDVLLNAVGTCLGVSLAALVSIAGSGSGGLSQPSPAIVELHQSE